MDLHWNKNIHNIWYRNNKLLAGSDIVLNDIVTQMRWTEQVSETEGGICIRRIRKSEDKEVKTGKEKIH